MNPILNLWLYRRKTKIAFIFLRLSKNVIITIIITVHTYFLILINKKLKMFLIFNFYWLLFFWAGLRGLLTSCKTSFEKNLVHVCEKIRLFQFTIFNNGVFWSPSIHCPIVTTLQLNHLHCYNEWFGVHISCQK